jgi:antitoxin component YwqK of YwqJK toxin-antitoxin module
MNRLFAGIALLLSSSCFGQVENHLAALLSDAPPYVDSTILQVVDTNHRDKQLNPHGIWRTRSLGDAGKLNMVASYYHGRMFGHALTFHDNGQIAVSCYYYDNEANGPFVSFYYNGKVQSTYNYVGGKADGVFKEYDTSGRLERVRQFNMGRLEGLVVLFYESGNVKRIQSHTQGEANGVAREYSDSADSQVILEEDMRDGVRVQARHYENGCLLKTENFDYETEKAKQRILRSKEGDG